MTIDEAKAKLQRRLMVADCPPIDPTCIDTIAALIVDVDREAREQAAESGEKARGR